ncbi:MAG: hypothetical protein HDT44_08495 [Ruminococcaceae bacterium]|nr:hypothetical protein [Oscillospiraceae bacterium]
MADTNIKESEERQEIKELREITKVFNRALRKSVREKYKELKDKKPTIYQFIFEEARKKRIAYEQLTLGKTPPDDRIEYFWIEYKEDEKRMKWNFFYRDVDIGSGNVHVTPGLFEKYEYVEEEHFKQDKQFKNKQFVETSSGKVKIHKLKSGPYYQSFAEMDGKGWWVPKSDFLLLKKYSDIIRTEEFEIMNDLDEIAVTFYLKQNKAYPFEKTKFEINTSSVKDTITLSESGGKPHHKIFRWLNVKFKENDSIKKYSINFTKPIYFKNYGFFTQYICLDIAKEENTKSGNVVTTNYPIVKSKNDYDKAKDNNKEILAPNIFNVLNDQKWGEIIDKLKAFINEDLK